MYLGVDVEQWSGQVALLIMWWPVFCLGCYGWFRAARAAFHPDTNPLDRTIGSAGAIFLLPLLFANPGSIAGWLAQPSLVLIPGLGALLGVLVAVIPTCWQVLRVAYLGPAAVQVRAIRAQQAPPALQPAMRVLHDRQHYDAQQRAAWFALDSGHPDWPNQADSPAQPVADRVVYGLQQRMLDAGQRQIEDGDR